MGVVPPPLPPKKEACGEGMDTGVWISSGTTQSRKPVVRSRTKKPLEIILNVILVPRALCAKALAG